MALSLCDCFHNCSVVLLLHQQPTCKLQSRRRTSARSHIADNICPDTLSEGGGKDIADTPAVFIMQKGLPAPNILARSVVKQFPPSPVRQTQRQVTQKGEGGSNKKKVQLDPASFYSPFCLDPTSGKKKGEAGKLQVRLSPYIRMERPEGLITLPPSLQPSLLRDDAQ